MRMSMVTRTLTPFNGGDSPPPLRGTPNFNLTTLVGHWAAAMLVTGIQEPVPAVILT